MHVIITPSVHAAHPPPSDTVNYSPFRHALHTLKLSVILILLLCRHRLLLLLLLDFLFRFLEKGISNQTVSSSDAMSAKNYPFSCTDNTMQRRQFQIERRPRLLRDFLTDDSNSCSSSGFKSFPRKRSHCTVRSILERDGGETDSNSNNKSTFLRSRSTATTRSVFQKASEIVIKAVRSPSLSLKRRFWRRNSTEEEEEQEQEMTVTVIRVKDIVRMRSFRDVIEEKSPPSDSTGSITTTATTSSNGSSWCESDFTADCTQSWNRNSGEFSDDYAVKTREKYLISVGDGDADTTTSNDAMGSKEKLPNNEKEQQSPVSVLDFPFTEDAEPLFFVGEEEQEAEERAMQLLDQIKATGLVQFSDNLNDDLLLDFCKDELIKIIRRNQTVDKEVDAKILTIAEAWLSGEFGWGVETEKEACIGDMERGGRWRRFEDEEEEMALLLEAFLFEILVDEVLCDLYVN